MRPPSRIEEVALTIFMASVLAVILLWMTGCAHVDRAQSADGLTTIVALEQGFAETTKMAFERLNGTLRRLFGRLRIEASRNWLGTQEALTVAVNGTPQFTVRDDGAIYSNNTLGSLIFASRIGPVGFGMTGLHSADWVFRQVDTDALGFRGGAYLNVGSSTGIGWSSTWSATTYADVRIGRDTANTLAQQNGANAQESRLYGSYTSATAYQRLSTKSISQAVTCAAGASVVTTISIPKYTHLIGVTTRVTTEIGATNGTTGYQVGDGTDADLWGAITGVAVGTSTDRTNFTAVDALGPDGSDRTITLTAVGGNFNGTGVIEVCAFYLAAEAD